MTKIIKTKKGSVFILVLVSLTVVLILGTVITMASMVNYNMNNVDSDVKSTFYYAESGNDQLHLLLSKKVKLAYEESQKKTIADIKTEIIDINGNIKSTYITAGDIDNTKIQAYQKTQFDKHFKSYFKVEYEKVDGTDLVNYLEDPNNMQLLNGQVEKAKVDVLKDKIKTFDNYPGDRFIIPVEVAYEDRTSNMKKTIYSEYVVKVPAFNYSLFVNKSSASTVVKRGADEILQNVMTTNKIEIRKNASVFVEQSFVYAKGNEKNPASIDAGITIDGGTMDVRNGRSIIISKGGMYLKSNESKFVLEQGTVYSQRVEKSTSPNLQQVNVVNATLYDMENLANNSQESIILNEFDNYTHNRY